MPNIDHTLTAETSKRFDFWLWLACALYVTHLVGWMAYAVWATRETLLG